MKEPMALNPGSSAATARLLEREWSTAELAEAAARVAIPAVSSARTTRRSSLVFRVTSEWLSVATSVVKEVLDIGRGHLLPHRRGIVEGLVNVHGELVTRISLAALLDLKSGGPPAKAPRLIVLGRESLRVACLADEIGGIEHYTSEDLQRVPTTLSRGAMTYTSALLRSGDRLAACLDDELLFYSIAKGLL